MYVIDLKFEKKVYLLVMSRKSLKITPKKFNIVFSWEIYYLSLVWIHPYMLRL